MSAYEIENKGGLLSAAVQPSVPMPSGAGYAPGPDAQLATLTAERAADKVRIGELEQVVRDVASKACDFALGLRASFHPGTADFAQDAECIRRIAIKALSPSATGMVVVERELLERFIAATCAKLPRDRGAYMNALAELRALLKVSP